MKKCDIAALPLLLALGVFGLQAAADDLQDADKLFKQGDNAQALDKVNSYLADHPKDAKARFLLGLIYTEQNKSAEAIKVFTALTQDYPELPEPYNNLAVLYAAQGQYDKARIALETAIRTHPSYAIAHENLGDIYAKLATQAYDKALQFDKTNTTAQTKLELIKELFSGSPRVAKAAAKTEAANTDTVSAATASAPASQQVKAENLARENQPVAATTPSDNVQDVLNTVNGWAQAWSEGNVTAYLAYYAPDFKTPNGEKRELWEKSRKERIAMSMPIQVSIIDPKVTLGDPTHAKASFKQDYQSKILKSTSAKTLHLVKSGDKWLIQMEQAGR
ncbi:MAG TPA: tetratricopeptide repeat protein [Burkholderiales bacterium]|nr:tetratricopeptide repeat protein [Burkholderiales bacterium]